jgi:hypothetical protein
MRGLAAGQQVLLQIKKFRIAPNHARPDLDPREGTDRCAVLHHRPGHGQTPAPPPDRRDQPGPNRQPETANIQYCQ